MNDRNENQNQNASLSLDDLIALNHEIASLVRAGVPLEQGLAELGPDLPGRLGQYTAALAQRTARGESLAQAIAGDADRLPTAYRAVIEAGIRAGRLPAALESVADGARQLSESRRTALLAVTYPLMVLVVAWCGLLFFTCVLAPQLAAMFRAFDVPGRGFLETLATAGRNAWYWGPVFPVVLVLLFIVWRMASARPNSRRLGWARSFLSRAPWMGRMLQYSRAATFLDVLALLVEHQTPLPEAVVLAAESSGDPETLHSARQLATAIESGQSLPEAAPAFPPLVGWLLMAAGRGEALLPALRHAAAACRRRARHQSDMFHLFTPIFFTIAVGGGVVALYALMLFLPYVSMLYALGG